MANSTYHRRTPPAAYEPGWVNAELAAIERALSVGVKPAVTGSRGGNTALASLITALATLGLITDSSTT